MRLPIFCLVAVATALVGCGQDKTVDKTIKRPGEPDVTFVAGDDPQMKKAIEKARATVADFIKALQEPKAAQSGFAIKKAFNDGKHTEHMWLSPVTYDGKKLKGTVNNEPVNLTNVKLGAKIAVDPAEISDWMYIDDGKLVGGYTIRRLRDTLGPEERAKFDKTLPFKID
jgi:uncharacterized protein YegJ (DUF2314 family)